VIGRVYHYIVRIMFGLKLRDVDCDFRLMRHAIFERINLEKTSGIICVEMMKKIQDNGFRITEVPVHHFIGRTAGRSFSTSAGCSGQAGIFCCSGTRSSCDASICAAVSRRWRPGPSILQSHLPSPRQ